ncbi:hypothetical protein E2I00_009242, partial [Balaenoptera physalus]
RKATAVSPAHHLGETWRAAGGGYAFLPATNGWQNLPGPRVPAAGTEKARLLCAMGGPVALLAALWALGAAGDAALRIGAFNIRSFGDSKELVLIPLHAAPHQAVAEIDALYDVYLDAQTRFRGAPQDMLFLGDFNADCSYVRSQDWPAIRLRSSEVFKWLIPDSADTTVGNSDCAYDRIVVCGARLRSSLKPQSAAALAISDHFPVEVTLKSH